MSGLELELRMLWVATAVYVLAGTVAIFGVVLRKEPERTLLALLVLALTVQAVAIGLRWERVGHGPFITLFEVLSSNVWSLCAVYSLAFWRIRPIRPTAAIVLPILVIMLTWLLVSNPGEGFFPPTYDTGLLYIHVFFGKVFLGTVVIAVGVAGVVLLRAGGATGHLQHMPDNRSLEELAYRFMTLALIFDTLMLVAGAVWAQDAWGRYWDWDPLETWAFVTWLLLGFAIHARLTYRPRPLISAAMVWIVFVMAFLTFFGVPFVSTVPHKGAL